MFSGAAQLHECIKRHDEKPAEHAEHRQIKQDTPDHGLRQQRHQVVHIHTRRDVRRSKIQVDPEQGQADGTKRHQPDFHMLARHPFAKQRAQPDPHRKDRQQQGYSRLRAAQDKTRVRRKLGEKERTEEPEPRNAENGKKYRAILAGKIDVVPGFGNRVEVDLQSWGGRWRRRNRTTGQVAGNSNKQSARGNPCRMFDRTGEQPADQRTDQDGDESTSLDQCIAANQFIGMQVLRQDGVLDRPEEGRVQAEQEKRPHQHGQAVHGKTARRHPHDDDFQHLDQTRQLRLVVLVGQLTGGR